MNSGPPDLVFLHGYDSRPGAMLPLAELLSAAFPDAEKRLLSGPVRLADDDRVSFAWWGADYDADDVDEAVSWLRTKLNRPTVLLGFSQGGALALAAAARNVEHIVGVVSMSAFLPDGFDPGSFAVPLLLVHGEDDDVVDVFNAERLHRQTTKQGLNSTLTLFSGGHRVPEDDQVLMLVSWLRQHIA
jgi:predicted esterase